MGISLDVGNGRLQQEKRMVQQMQQHIRAACLLVLVSFVRPQAPLKANQLC